MLTRRRELNYFEPVPAPEKNFQCKVCKKYVCNTKSNLRRHEEICDLKLYGCKSFACEICLEKFYTQNTLEYHQLRNLYGVQVGCMKTGLELFMLKKEKLVQTSGPLDGSPTRRVPPPPPERRGSSLSHPCAVAEYKNSAPSEMRSGEQEGRYRQEPMEQLRSYARRRSRRTLCEGRVPESGQETPLHYATEDTPADERKRQRSPKDYTPPSPDTDAPKRMRPDSYGGPATPFIAPHTVWQVKDVETLDANSQSLLEEHDAKTGKSATIVKYNNEESGILSCGGEAKVVMFHVNQMWVFQSGIGWAQFREIYPTSELKAMFPPNSKIKCNIKRVDGGQIKFQATAVWLDGAPPPEYRTKEMMDDTQRICSSSKYSTGYVHYLNDPQTGGMDAVPREGVIQEYLSLETGLVRLVGRDGAVVLFNLDQVWIRRGVHSSLLKDDDRKILPQNYIPAGTRVIVTMRPIPAHKFSQLKYQAIYVCKQEIPGDVGLTKEFQQMYNSCQVRIDLGRMLHEHHDNFKRLAQLSKIKTLPTTTEMNLVPVVLNTLPVGGVALVIEADNGIMGHDMGLIKVAVPSSSQNMYVLFHLEDVFNTEGLPAIADQELTLESIINKNVDLIARSICPNDNSRDILGIVRKINERHPNAVIPVLQAVAVFIKNEVTGSFNPSKAPLPTYLRTDPKSFNSEQPGAAYYINYLLKSELDRKVMEFMEYSPESITQLLPSVLNPYLSNPAIKNHIPAKKVRSLKMSDESKRPKDDRPPRTSEPPRPWKWTTSLVGEVGTVQKVLNDNYGVAVGYQRHGYEERRFYVLFDTCDVWIGNEIAFKLNKKLKKDNLMAVGDHVRFHAIHVENAENTWNLNYLATAVISGKTRESVDRNKMPEKALSVKSLGQLDGTKATNFSQVAQAVCKKPPPDDPRERVRKEEAEKRAAKDREREKEMERRKEKERLRRPNAPGDGSSQEPKITLLEIKTIGKRQKGTLSLERGGSKKSKQCVSWYLPNKEDGSFVPCGEGCVCCQFSDPATEIVSKIHPNTVHIKGQISCKSKNLLYKLDCKRCESLTPGLNDTFIGATSVRVSSRLANHLRDANIPSKSGSVAKHFSSENHTNRDIKITPFMKCSTKRSLKKKERCYQHVIGSYPFGMNAVNH